jgi:hypothetical protein
MQEIQMKKITFLAVSLMLVTAFALSTTVAAAEKTYEVTITNITKGQVLTPVLVVAHSDKFSLFTPGKKAPKRLATLAETGNPEPLANKISKKKSVLSVETGAGLIPAGMSETITITVEDDGAYLSIATMLALTNDGFAAVRGVMLEDGAVYYANVWDAGSEANTESALEVPALGGEARHTDGAEKYVHIHAGVHGIADLDPAMHDWRNPGAMISIKEVK